MFVIFSATHEEIPDLNDHNNHKKKSVEKFSFKQYLFQTLLDFLNL